MLFCPDDLEPCRRQGCSTGHCQRSGDDALSSCWECGVVVTRRAIVAVCVECTARYSPHVHEET